MKIQRVLIIFIAFIFVFSCQKDENTNVNNNVVNNIEKEQYSQEQVKQMKSSFYDFKDKLISKLSKVNSMVDIKKDISKSFVFTNDFVGVYIEYNNEDDLRKIDNYIKLVHVKNVLDNGKYKFVREDYVYIYHPMKSKKPDDFPDIHADYSSNDGKWFLTGISYRRRP